jgi:hypothetical protein
VNKSVQNLPALRKALSAINDNYLNVQQDILFIDRGQLRRLAEPGRPQRTPLRQKSFYSCDIRHRPVAAHWGSYNPRGDERENSLGSEMTRYEIAARHRSGHKLLIGYTPHKSRPGLLAAVQRRSRSSRYSASGEATRLLSSRSHRIVAASANGALASLAAQRRAPKAKASYRCLMGITRAISRRAGPRGRRTPRAGSGSERSGGVHLIGRTSAINQFSG